MTKSRIWNSQIELYIQWICTDHMKYCKLSFILSRLSSVLIACFCSFGSVAALHFVFPSSAICLNYFKAFLNRVSNASETHLQHWLSTFTSLCARFKLSWYASYVRIEVLTISYLNFDPTGIIHIYLFWLRQNIAALKWNPE